MEPKILGDKLNFTPNTISTYIQKLNETFSYYKGEDNMIDIFDMKKGEVFDSQKINTYKKAEITQEKVHLYCQESRPIAVEFITKYALLESHKARFNIFYSIETNGILKNIQDGYNISTLIGSLQKSVVFNSIPDIEQGNIIQHIIIMWYNNEIDQWKNTAKSTFIDFKDADVTKIYNELFN